MIQIVITDLGTIKLAEQILAGMPAKIKQVVRRANVDTVRAVRAEIPKAINARYDISKSNIRSNMRLTTKSEDGGMVYGLIITGRRIPMIQFNVTPREPPVQRKVPVGRRVPITVVTVRGQGQIGRPNRFLAKLKSGHAGVFRRKSGSKSLPIAESLSESIPEMIRTKAVREQIEKRARDTLQKSIDRNLRIVLEKT